MVEIGVERLHAHVAQDLRRAPNHGPIFVALSQHRRLIEQWMDSAPNELVAFSHKLQDVRRPSDCVKKLGFQNHPVVRRISAMLSRSQLAQMDRYPHVTDLIEVIYHCDGHTLFQNHDQVDAPTSGGGGKKGAPKLLDGDGGSASRLDPIWCRLATAFLRSQIGQQPSGSFAYLFRRFAGETASEWEEVAKSDKLPFQPISDFTAPADNIAGEFDFSMEGGEVFDACVTKNSSMASVFSVTDPNPCRIKGGAGSGTQHKLELSTSAMAVASHRIIHAKSSALGERVIVDGRPGSLKTDGLGSDSHDFVLLDSLGKTVLSRLKQMEFKSELVYAIPERSLLKPYILQCLAGLMSAPSDRVPWELIDDGSARAKGLREAVQILAGQGCNGKG